jgi:peptide/nickel transport system substrate-binding protein
MRKALFVVMTILLVTSALAACGGTPEVVVETVEVEKVVEKEVEKVVTEVVEVEKEVEKVVTEVVEVEKEVEKVVTEVVEVEKQVSAPAVDRDHTLILAIPGDVETIDPPFGAATRANETLKNLYDPMVLYKNVDSGEGYARSTATEFEPALVESWEISDDGLTVVLNLREGVTFPMTGNELTAEDLYYKFERAFGVQAGTAWLFGVIGIKDISQVEITGPYQVTISLENPSPIFFNLLRDQDGGLVDSEAVKAHATDDDPWANKWMAKNYAGAGEYILESWIPGVEFVMTANPQYWGGEPYFRKVILKIVPSSTDRALLLQQGAVDIAADLSIDEMQSIKDSEGVKILSIPSREHIGLGLNNAMEPFTDPKVRQALAYAVPYETIVNDLYQGEAGMPMGIMPGASEWHTVDWPYTHDPEKAKELLADAGYPDGFEFTLAIQQGIATMEEIAVVLQDAFRDIGVDMKIEKQAAAIFQEHMAKKEQPAFVRPLLSYVDDPYYDLFLFYETGQVVNWMNYSNPRIDEITAEIGATIDQDKRRELSTEAQQILTDEVAAVYLAETNRMIATRDDIEGWVVDPDPLLKYWPLFRTEQ